MDQTSPDRPPDVHPAGWASASMQATWSSGDEERSREFASRGDQDVWAGFKVRLGRHVWRPFRIWFWLLVSVGFIVGFAGGAGVEPDPETPGALHVAMVLYLTGFGAVAALAAWLLIVIAAFWLRFWRRVSRSEKLLFFTVIGAIPVLIHFLFWIAGLLLLGSPTDAYAHGTGRRHPTAATEFGSNETEPPTLPPDRRHESFHPPAPNDSAQSASGQRNVPTHCRDGSGDEALLRAAFERMPRRAALTVHEARRWEEGDPSIQLPTPEREFGSSLFWQGLYVDKILIEIRGPAWDVLLGEGSGRRKVLLFDNESVAAAAWREGQRSYVAATQ